MITHSSIAFGETFPAAVTIAEIVVVRREDGSATGFNIFVTVNMWASDAARLSQSDTIKRLKIMFSDTSPPNYQELFCPIGLVFAMGKFKAGGHVITAIENAMITLPEWLGGVIT